MTIYGLQYDSTTALPVPRGLCAFYYNGRYAHRPYTTGRGRVWIDVLGTAPDKAYWLDVEPGDASPESFAGWNARRRAAVGSWGGVYCNRSTLPEVLEDLPADQHAGLWLATLDGTADPRDIPVLRQLPGNVTLMAIQAFPELMAGFHADISVVVNKAYWDARHS